ncbi:hypothetical protein KEM56_005598 [Ascosphaera pollenicola]|nr:hypothetical protein KEM56_005598 [Ascosphaera pollenicola]
MNTRRRSETKKTQPIPSRQPSPDQRRDEPAAADDEPPAKSSDDDDELVKSQPPVKKRRSGAAFDSLKRDCSWLLNGPTKRKVNAPTQRSADTAIFGCEARKPRAQKTYSHQKPRLGSGPDKPARSGVKKQNVDAKSSSRSSKDTAENERGKQHENDKKRDRKENEKAKTLKVEPRNENLALLDELEDSPGSSNTYLDYSRASFAGKLSTLDSSDARSDMSDDDTSPVSGKGNGNAVCCPICSCPMYDDLADECQLVLTQPFRRQTAFCQRHTRKRALEEWEERSYPKIDWETFEERIASCFPTLEEIITGKRSSFYRKLMTKQADEEGDKSTMKKYRLTVESKNLESISTGYYGPRGAKLMVDTLIEHFARKMRKQATTDKLIKNASVAGFVQAVLVPELTLLFVKEDMHANDQDARRIIEESKRIGELLNDQPHESVTSER